GCLLQFAQAINELCDVAVHDVSIVLGVGVGGFEFDDALEVAPGAFPFAQSDAMRVERTTDGFSRGFQLFALATAPNVCGEQLFEIVSFEGFIGKSSRFICLLCDGARRSSCLASRWRFLQLLGALIKTDPAEIV